MTPDPKAGAKRVVRALRLVSRVGRQGPGRLTTEGDLLGAWLAGWVSVGFPIAGWAAVAFLGTIALTVDHARQLALEVCPEEVPIAEGLLRDLLADLLSRVRCGRCRGAVTMRCPRCAAAPAPEVTAP